MKNFFRKYTLIICPLMLALSACTPPVSHATPSAKAEVTINGTTKAIVKDQITNQAMNYGYRVTKSDDSVIALDRSVDNAMAAAFFGSRYDSTPNARISYNLMQNGKDVRVIADLAIITNPGSGFEQRTDVNGSQDSLMVQNWLNSIKSDIEKKKKK